MIWWVGFARSGLTVSSKESSDELKSVESRFSSPRTSSDYLALALATCGVGFLPLAPGTFGSLVGVGLYLLLRIILVPRLPGGSDNVLTTAYGFLVFELLLIVLVVFVGIWAASRVEQLDARKDPGKVVVDEVAGQLIALTAVPVALTSWWPTILAFLLFRFFDIVKPYPARRLESLKGGLGIMADDVIAGIYAAVGVALIVSVRWL
ncbi:MAG TPA: phosphatidylglycerophosphatase A [Pyrinomonadaceae bacterium]|nr:phosphatidylglycerophosphatase A [Pyrinomonadaceae bacterium]